MRVGLALGGVRTTVLTRAAPCAPPRPLARPAQLNKAFQAEESPSVIFCISMQWFREWEAFVKGKDNGEWSGRALVGGSAGSVREARRGARGCARSAGFRGQHFR